jgi:hypothetical protein
MENFFNWISKPVKPEDIEVWFNVNNMIPEKGELFFDFCLSLFMLMKETYLGEEITPNETRIILSDDDKLKHFTWCWNKTIENFREENINFNSEGEHFDYFSSFFMEVYYSQKNSSVRDSIDSFFKDLFDKKVTFTKSDLDLYTELYKLLEKNISQ